MRLLIASKTLNLSGRYRGSRVIGKGVSYPQTLLIGAYRERKAFSASIDANSAPNPEVMGAS